MLSPIAFSPPLEYHIIQQQFFNTYKLDLKAFKETDDMDDGDDDNMPSPRGHLGPQKQISVDHTSLL